MNATIREKTLEGKSSPWGKIQGEEVIADGISAVSTAGHGGIKLSRARNAKVPEYMRRKGGWYEEDCEWAIPALVFAAEFERDKPSSIQSARSTMLHWYPDEYARFYGVSLESISKESRTLLERQFNLDHAEDYVVTAAWGSWHEKVPQGMVGVVATKGGNRSNAPQDRRYFLVTEKEYDARDGRFVIDSTHQEWTDHA